MPPDDPVPSSRACGCGRSRKSAALALRLVPRVGIVLGSKVQARQAAAPPDLSPGFADEHRRHRHSALFLVPDVSMVAYLTDPKRGAVGYNAIHTYLAPALLAGAMALRLIPVFWQVPLIWLGHIGLDRALGFGLKYPAAFRDTHLALRAADTAAA